MRHMMLLAMAAACTLGGCGFFAYALSPPMPEKTVQAEYANVPGHKLAIIVWTHESTEVDQPDLRGDLARYVQQAIKDGIERVTFVPQSKILKYQQTHLRWADTPPHELGRLFDAQMVLYIEVNHFVAARGGDVGMEQGRLSCKNSVYDLGYAEGKQAVWVKEDLSVEYPPRNISQGMTVDPAEARAQMLGMYSARLANCFRKHKEPKYE